MTLPEHAICSLMIAQFGVQQRLGIRGVICVTLAGISPDLDTASKLFGDEYFWTLHHALGHSLLSICVLTAAISGIGYWMGRLRPYGYLFRWCLTAAAVHCLTDAVYWWGIQPLWPFWPTEVCFSVIEYLDLIVLGIWLSAAVALYWYRDQNIRIATAALTTFTAYVLLRSVLPEPTGVVKLIAGGWMYAAPEGTPVLDWW
jgi:membrane-bound metal-dependent hydrolase YbcI (DUF457 family)